MAFQNLSFIKIILVQKLSDGDMQAFITKEIKVGKDIATYSEAVMDNSNIFW